MHICMQPFSSPHSDCAATPPSRKRFQDNLFTGCLIVDVGVASRFSVIFQGLLKFPERWSGKDSTSSPAKTAAKALSNRLLEIWQSAGMRELTRGSWSLPLQGSGTGFPGRMSVSLRGAPGLQSARQVRRHV